jgi:hypothetical protein
MVPAIRTSDDAKSELEIFYRARHWSGDGEIGKSQRTRGTWDLPVCRHDPVTRLMAGNTRHMRRQTNRTANIAAELQRGESARQGRSRPAR